MDRAMSTSAMQQNRKYDAGGRPALMRSNASTSSIASTSSDGGSNGVSSSSRLLWRGSFVTQSGLRLYGIAIIAHLFSVPSTSFSSSHNTPHVATPSATATNFSPFDDPFSSKVTQASSGADMCLGLEMLRGRDLQILAGEEEGPGTGTGSGRGKLLVQHVQNPTSPLAPVLSSHFEGQEKRREQQKDRKGKGRGIDEDRILIDGEHDGNGNTRVDHIKVETPTDVRVYVDERCTETVEWFQDTFCREGCQGRGIKLDAGGEQIVIFAQRPTSGTLETGTANISPTTSSTALDNPLPPLTLLLGRPFKPVVRKPRPDDPLPRESLFTAKLRKTASLPASAFSKSLLSNSQDPVLVGDKRKLSNPRSSLSSKDKAIASLLGNNNPSFQSDHVGLKKPILPQRRQNSIPPLIHLPTSLSVPAASAGGGRGGKRSLSRSFSTSATASSSHRLFTATDSSSSAAISTRQGSLPPPPAFLLTTDNTNSARDEPGSEKRVFKRSRSSLPTSSFPPIPASSFDSVPTETRLPAFVVDSSTGLDPGHEHFDSRRHSQSRATTPIVPPASPTLSIASTSLDLPPSLRGQSVTTHRRRTGVRTCATEQIDTKAGGQYEIDHESEEERDRLEHLREIGIQRQRVTNGILVDSAANSATKLGGYERCAKNSGGSGAEGSGMKRSLSVPVSDSAGARSLRLQGDRNERTNLEASSVHVNPNPNGNGVNAIEVKNKNSVKKLTMNRLQALGIGRDHPEFKELFAMVTRGVGFALRATFKLAILSTEERENAEQLIEEHLTLYLAPEYQHLLLGIEGTEPLLAEEKVESTVEEARYRPLELTKTEVDLGGERSLCIKREGVTELELGIDRKVVGDCKLGSADMSAREITSSDTIIGDDHEMDSKDDDKRRLHWSEAASRKEVDIVMNAIAC